MRIDRRLALLAAALCLAAGGCGAQEAQVPPPQPAEVQGTDPDDLPGELSERGRRPSETFCDGPYSTASSC